MGSLGLNGIRMEPSRTSIRIPRDYVMKTNRRTFMNAAIAGGLAASSLRSSAASEVQEPDYAQLDGILEQPVLRRELFPHPVIIESLELLRYRSSFLCRVRSSDGAEGVSVAHYEMRSLYPIFGHALRPFFMGKDARDLDLLLEKVYIYKLNFRLSGLAIGGYRWLPSNSRSWICWGVSPTSPSGS